MLARLQRGVLATLAWCALVWLAACWSLDRPRLGLVGLLVFGGGHTVVLALEFALLATVHGDDPAPRAGPVALFTAWLGECALSWRVFCWQQPFRADRWPDVPGRMGVRGVVFVHGYICNRGSWNPWLARCHAQRRPCIGINLEPVFSDLDAYVPQLDQAIARLEHETGLPPVLVAHSMGGLVARAWLASNPSARTRVHRIVTIGAPHQGTWLARWSTTQNSRPMRPSSPWLNALATRESAERSGDQDLWTCFYGHADNIVMPPSAATLAGADNRHLRATAHVALAFHPDVTREVERWLDSPVAASGDSDNSDKTAASRSDAS